MTFLLMSPQRRGSWRGSNALPTTAPSTRATPPPIRSDSIAKWRPTRKSSLVLSFYARRSSIKKPWRYTMPTLSHSSVLSRLNKKRKARRRKYQRMTMHRRDPCRRISTSQMINAHLLSRSTPMCHKLRLRRFSVPCGASLTKTSPVPEVPRSTKTWPQPIGLATKKKRKSTMLLWLNATFRPNKKGSPLLNRRSKKPERFSIT
mmetsp:Transcript_43022/g.66108  ORF Transcript_43022/g.66108 Transcript_43022/m.66108 type:complete len:204 (+) Transcript_43022:456-1067(+)